MQAREETEADGMAINLPEHSRTAYEAACTMLSAYGKAAVIQPAGSRNYLIGFRLCADHPDKQFLWLTPSACIYRVQTAYLASVNEHVPDQIVSLTYDELDSQLPKLSASFRPDCCILDEYQSAESAASAAAHLRRLFPKILLFGLSSSGTSRPENRKLTAEPDLFFRAVAYEMTLGEAIVRGILLCISGRFLFSGMNRISMNRISLPRTAKPSGMPPLPVCLLCAMLPIRQKNRNPS